MEVVNALWDSWATDAWSTTGPPEATRDGPYKIDQS